MQEAKAELIQSGAELIRLGPLDREAVAQVATDVLGAEPDTKLLQKADRVQGNPFLLVEFFRRLQDHLLVSLDSGRATLIEDRLPHRVSDGMRGRLARMSPASQRAATFASGLGRRFAIHDLATLTDMTITELIGPVNELVQADIFAADGGQLAFRHDIIREAVRGSLLSPVRRAIDRHAADVLLARGALPVEVATQLVESAEPGDDIAIETALKATQALGASDPAAADRSPVGKRPRWPRSAVLAPQIYVPNSGPRCTTASAWRDGRTRRSTSSRLPARPRTRARASCAGSRLSSRNLGWRTSYSTSGARSKFSKMQNAVSSMAKATRKLVWRTCSEHGFSPPSTDTKTRFKLSTPG
jgi:hypothetical protein